MGIQGLLQFLKEASEPVHVMKFKGQTVAVDTYCWIHKGAFACAEKLAKGEPTDQYVAYCMKFVDMLLGCGVKPILVFDGCTLPSKKEVEKSRRERREMNLQKGKQLLREGKLSEARECFTRCVNVTPAMAHNVIKAARARGVDCIVAPYEADSQLAYLNKTGVAQAIITEDSDLLAFGCKKVILKMDKFGNGLEIDQSRLGMCKQLGDVFTEEKFRYMCILSGCDYLASLHGIGLAKACKLLKIANNPDIIKVIKKIGQYLKMNITVPDDYITGFIRANNTFLYQLVFDPLKRKLMPLNPYADDIDPETLDYAGRNIGNPAAFQIAIGNKDINTMEQIDDYNPDTAQQSQLKSRRWSDSVADKNTMLYSSIWKRGFQPGPFNIHTSPTKTKEPEKQSTKGVEKVISIKGLKLPRKEHLPKRPREELSDVDLLSQYSFTKKAKKESCEENCTPLKLSATALGLQQSPNSAHENVNSQHKVRNRFATLLKMKNEEPGTVVVPGTRSRFFCSSVSDCSVRNEIHESPLSHTSSSRNVLENQSLNKDLLNLAEENDVAEDPPSLLYIMNDIEATKKETLDLPLPKEEVKTQSPKNKNCDLQSEMEDNHDACSLEEEKSNSQSSNEGKCRQTMLISPVGTPRSCFSWSSNLGGESTRTPNCSPGLLALQQFHRKTDGPKTPMFQSNKWTRLQEGSLEVNSMATVPDTESTPQSVGGWLQIPNNASQLSSKESISEDSDNDDTVSSYLSSPTVITKGTEIINTAPRNKVPGLHKSKSVGSCLVTKVKPLLPAKVSGLSRKSRSAQKKPVQNDENKPGLQATISGLWKQFGFKKEVSKISAKSSEPLSPVKDNLALTPEMDDGVYNKPECSRVQRSIF